MEKEEAISHTILHLRSLYNHPHFITINHCQLTTSDRVASFRFLSPPGPLRQVAIEVLPHQSVSWVIGGVKNGQLPSSSNLQETRSQRQSHHLPEHSTSPTRTTRTSSRHVFLRADVRCPYCPLLDRRLTALTASLPSSQTVSRCVVVEGDQDCKFNTDFSSSAWTRRRHHLPL